MAQFIVIPASATIAVQIDSRELTGSANGVPQRAEWTTPSPQLIELSYPAYLRYPPPPPGMPHTSNVIRVRCLQEGQATVTATPLDPTLQNASATIRCQ